jgi:hypothetical protein
VLFALRRGSGAVLHGVRAGEASRATGACKGESSVATARPQRSAGPHPRGPQRRKSRSERPEASWYTWGTPGQRNARRARRKSRGGHSSRRADSNRGPLHYEKTTSSGRASALGCGRDHLPCKSLCFATLLRGRLNPRVAKLTYPLCTRGSLCPSHRSRGRSQGRGVRFLPGAFRRAACGANPRRCVGQACRRCRDCMSGAVPGAVLGITRARMRRRRRQPMTNKRLDHRA